MEVSKKNKNPTLGMLGKKLVLGGGTLPPRGDAVAPPSNANCPHLPASEHLAAHPRAKSHPGRARSRITRQEWGKETIPASTEQLGEHKPPPEGSKGLPRREQMSPQGEQSSPPRGARVSLM